MRRCFLLFLALALLLGGCATEIRQPEWPTLTLCLPIRGDSAQIERVNEALNAHLETAAGIHVRIIPFSTSDALSKAIMEGEQIDLSYCGSLDAARQMLQAGGILPLDELLRQSGQWFLGVFPLKEYEFARSDGALFAMPTNKDRVRINGFEYNREIARQYHLDFSGVHSMEDLAQVFDALLAQTKEISPIAVVPGFIYFDQVNTLTDAYGVLTADSGGTVVNLYETDQFADFVHLMREWYLKGYTYADTGENDLILYYISSGKVLGCLTIAKPGFEVQERHLSGLDVGFVELGEPYFSTDTIQRAWYVIPATAADPTRSMQLMELLYTDPVAADLLIYGIEGEHYTLTSAGQVSRIEGSGYGGVTDWAYCNSFTAHVAEGLDPDFWQELQQANEIALRSPVWGFQFDAEPVAQQLYRCDLVVDQYLKLLYSGISDPDPLLEQFRQELKQAGIDEIIAEKQRQLDEFSEGR